MSTENYANDNSFIQNSDEVFHSEVLGFIYPIHEGGLRNQRQGWQGRKESEALRHKEACTLKLSYHFRVTQGAWYWCSGWVIPSLSFTLLEGDMKRSLRTHCLRIPTVHTSQGDTKPSLGHWLQGFRVCWLAGSHTNPHSYRLNFIKHQTQAH